MIQEIILTRHISLFAKDVLDYLKANAMGKENAIKISALAFHFECSRRDIELAVEECRGAGAPIASSVSGNMGLFVARNYEEIKQWFDQISHRMEKMAIHRACAIQTLKAQAQREGIQCELNLEVV